MCWLFNPKEDSAVSFPYQKNPLGLYFPVIRLQVYKKKNLVDIFTLVDSGASISVFKTEVADLLGIKISDGEKIDLGGVGGRINGYMHRLYINLAGKRILTSVVFSKDYNVSFNLLGRKNIFENFKICFEEKKKTVSFQN